MAVLNYADKIYLNGQEVDRVYLDGVQVYPPDYYQLFKDRVLADNGAFIENPIDFNNEKLLLTPNAYKEEKIYSALPKDGSGDFTFSRNSSATYIDEDGIIKTAQANVPRIQDGKILIEEQSTNLIVSSSNFNTNWLKGAIYSIIENAVVTPDGSSTGSKMFPSTSNGFHFIYAAINSNKTTTQTMSCFFKASDYKFAIILFNDNNKNQGVEFDLTLGIVVSTDGDKVTHRIEAYDNGWFKCQVTITNPIDLRNVQLRISIGDANSFAGFAGEITKGLFLWGAQLELGNKSSSYIPTNGTAVTRLADIATVSPPLGTTQIIETIDGVEQPPITVIPPTYQLPEGEIDNVKMI